MNHAQQHAAAGYRVSSPVRNFASVWTSKHTKNLRSGAYSNHVIYKLHHQLFFPLPVLFCFRCPVHLLQCASQVYSRFSGWEGQSRGVNEQI